jgi:hypothetical protein
MFGNESQCIAELSNLIPHSEICKRNEDEHITMQMGKACSTEAKRNAYRILVAKPKEKRPLGRLRSR